MEYIDKLITEQLEGNKNRVVELFVDDSFLIELRENSTLNDWFRFEGATYDGEYLIKDGHWYVVFRQERGCVYGHERHKNLKDAAYSLFTGAGYFGKL